MGDKSTSSEFLLDLNKLIFAKHLEHNRCCINITCMKKIRKKLKTRK
jgi:hypothetical protein